MYSTVRSTGLRLAAQAGKSDLLAEFCELCCFTALIGLCIFAAMDLAQKLHQPVVLWAADGLFLGALLTTRPVLRPLHVVSTLAAIFAAAMYSGASPSMSAATAMVTLLEVVAATILVRHYIGSDCDLSQSRSLWRFALVALFVSMSATALSAGFGMLSLSGAPAFELVISLFSHALGLVTITPAVLALRRGSFTPQLSRENIAKTLMAFALMLATTLLVFGQTRYPLLFMVFPPLVLVVFVCRFSGGAISLCLATLISIGATISSNGPLMLISNSTHLERIVIIQLFLVVAAIMVLTLSVLLAEYDLADQRLRHAKDDLAQLATTDGLTGLANRRRMNDVLDQECRRAAREQKPLSFLLLDVDNFKAFNDCYGHQAGDECLRAIADVLKSFGRRPTDLAARYGGEEMALILPTADEAGAFKMAESIRAAIEALALPHAGNTSGQGVVTASIGIATAGLYDVSHTPTSLIATADVLLYEAKRTGRNKVLTYGTRLIDPVPPPIADEERRAALTESYFHSGGEQRAKELDRIAELAARMLETPIALVSLVGRNEQVFVGRYGLDATSTGRDVSFCAHAITGGLPMVVPNAVEDERFKNNALVTGDLNIRFYAGAPLISTTTQLHLGALCVIDHKAHVMLTGEQKALLASLARLAMVSIERKCAVPSKDKTHEKPVAESAEAA